MQSPSNLPSSHFAFRNRKTRSSPSNEVSLCEKTETPLPGSFTRNNSIHFADSTRKCYAKQYGRSFEEKTICVTGLLASVPGREWSSRATVLRFLRSARGPCSRSLCAADGLVS